MHLLAGVSALRAAAIALLLALGGVSAAFASAYTGTVSVSDKITEIANAEATLSLTVTAGDGSEPLALSALHALPPGLSIASDSWSSDSCAPNSPLGIGGTCELTVTLKGDTVGSYDWSGTGDDGTNSITLTTIGSIVVATAPALVGPVSGDSQSTRVGTAFSQPLTIEVVDNGGNPVPDIDVVFTAPADGATATLSDTNVRTGADGRASVTATASSTVGSYFVEAKLTDYPDLSVNFYLDNIPPPAKLEATVSWSESPVPVAGQFTANITLKNTSNSTINRTLIFNGIPALPSGLEMVGSFDWGTCGSQFSFNVMNTCTMSATVRATATGKHFWTGDGTPGRQHQHLHPVCRRQRRHRLRHADRYCRHRG